MTREHASDKSEMRKQDATMSKWYDLNYITNVFVEEKVGGNASKCDCLSQAANFHRSPPSFPPLLQLLILRLDGSKSSSYPCFHCFVLFTWKPSFLKDWPHMIQFHLLLSCPPYPKPLHPSCTGCPVLPITVWLLSWGPSGVILFFN